MCYSCSLFLYIYIYYLYILTDLIIKRVFEALFAGSIGYIGFEELVWGSIFGGYWIYIVYFRGFSQDPLLLLV